MKLWKLKRENPESKLQYGRHLDDTNMKGKYLDSVKNRTMCKIRIETQTEHIKIDFSNISNRYQPKQCETRKKEMDERLNYRRVEKET